VDVLEKILPFLTSFPRWLQTFFFAVLVQVLLMVLLGTVYAFRSTVAKAQPVPLVAFPLNPEFTESPQNGEGLSASLVVNDEGSYPTANVTILNSNDKSDVFVAFDLVVEEYVPVASIPETRVLKPLAMIDVNLPMGAGHQSYGLKQPVLVAPGDAAMLAFRFSCQYEGRPVSPREVAAYRLRIVLRSQSGRTVGTRSFDI
jgi:hypothetical protein